MTGGLILAALAFVICAFVQIQIQVFFENLKFDFFVQTESTVFYQLTKVVYRHAISINESNSNVTKHGSKPQLAGGNQSVIDKIIKSCIRDFVVGSRDLGYQLFYSMTIETWKLIASFAWLKQNLIMKFNKPIIPIAVVEDKLVIVSTISSMRTHGIMFKLLKS